ncbi:sensor histidine kinase [Caulobacter sp. SL161]|uniref:sensor histidine kinase n=1 Tax=Caulobacter sp. SL161 TaxID=2995156 RepID=UPI00227338E2|nr:HWE histidine kinase domain-containing protein [Caulobacter sp. SL161]MCY1647689.1 sensor histidine kinase [Caulobacter sp. SL161]
MTTNSATRAPSTVTRRLLFMALTLAAPAILLMAALVAVQYTEGQRRFAAQLVTTTRALSLATDRQIGQGQSVLQGLAVSPALSQGDLATFEKQAREAVDGRDGWIVLMDKDRQWINTRMPAGAPPPNAPPSEQSWREMTTGKSNVSNLIPRPNAGPIIGVNMPVLVDGQIFVLAYMQHPAVFHALMTGQGLPETWTASIVDRNAALLARSHDQEKMLGRHASLDMQRAMALAQDGVVDTHTLDGVQTLSAFSRSPTYGWTFIVGVPHDELNRTILGSLGPALLGSALMIALGVMAALAFARPISRDVRGLVAEAEALAAGAPLAPAPSALQEIAEVRGSLRAAAEILHHREEEARAAAERQQLMINELNHRVKNTLVVVQSLARHSLKGGGELGLAQFNERLLALAGAHDLLTRRSWEGADLGELVAEALQPYATQVSIEGPATPLAPNAAVALAMILHELATNASKYGALSTDAGRIQVSWTMESRTRLRLIWRERGGPPVKPPSRRGFGSRLISSSLRGDLSGASEFDYAPEGLTCVFRLQTPPRSLY